MCKSVTNAWNGAVLTEINRVIPTFPPPTWQLRYSFVTDLDISVEHPHRPAGASSTHLHKRGTDPHRQNGPSCNACALTNEHQEAT